MLHRTIALGELTISREFTRPAAEVFAAWAEVEHRKRWGTPAENVELRFDHVDFSIGGGDIAWCLVDGAPVAKVLSHYADIVPGSRIVLVEAVEVDGKSQGINLVSAEFYDIDGGSRLVVSVQSSALDGSGLEEGVKDGWPSALDRLLAYMEREPAPAD